MNVLMPTSAAGFAAFDAGLHPPTELIDADTAVCAIELPEGGIVTSTLSYVFRGADGSAHVVDPGWSSDAGIAAIRDTLELLDAEAIDSVVVTHLHADHLGMAERLRQEFGAKLVMSAVEWQTYRNDPDDARRNERYDRWGVSIGRRPQLPALTGIPGQSPHTAPDVLVRDQDTLDLGRPVRVVATPGHTEGSISLIDGERELILTGDHVLPHINPGIGLDYDPDGDPVGDYLAALEKILEYDGYDVLPGHGYRFTRLHLRAAGIARHHLRRASEVAEVLQAPGRTEPTVWEVASRLSWTRGWGGLEGYFLNSALQQTAMHMRFVASGTADRWLAADPPAWLTVAEPALRTR